MRSEEAPSAMQTPNPQVRRRMLNIATAKWPNAAMTSESTWSYNAQLPRV
jgi:hypothetical protein